jgi:hypothetical protein
MDEFEQFLKKQPFRDVPSAWRREILHPSSLGPKPNRPQWQEWLWPSPVAWAGLAFAWMVIIGLNLATGPTREQTAGETSVVSSDMVAALAEERSLLSESISPAPVLEPPRRKTSTSPRSDIRGRTAEA